MDSVVDQSQGIKLCEELNQLWSKAGMQAHKWLSNSTKVLERIPVERRASEVHIASDGLPMVKTLGVTWLPEEDVFTFIANPPEKDFPLTKRNFLKKIAKLFDPVGFLAPFLIRAKILLQEMWAAGMDWDDLFLGDLASKARKWFKELEDLHTIKVARCLRLGQEEEMLSQTLHTFVDASQDAYGAVVYSRATFKSGAVYIHNICCCKVKSSTPCSYKHSSNGVDGRSSRIENGRIHFKSFERQFGSSNFLVG